MRPPPRLWAGAAAAVFVVQSHCGMPAVPHGNLAQWFAERGLHERALVSARRAARETPRDPRPHAIAAIAHAGLGARREAVAALEHALRLDPDDPRLYGTLRSLAAGSGQEALALEALRRLEEDRPGHWLLRLNLGWAHAAAGHREEALRRLEEVVESADSTAPRAERTLAHYELSRLYLDEDRTGDAARILESGLGLDPDDPLLLLGAGESRLRAGEPERARRHFARALDNADDMERTASSIARIYYDSGLRELAIEYYEKAAGRSRPSPLVLNNLAWTYAEAGLRLDRAQELSLRAVKSDADNVVYLDTYAEVLFRRGRTGQAIALMRRCLELEPEDGEHYEYLRGQMARFEAAADSLL